MPSDTKESKVDVLVVGAGPAGLMCAYALAKVGVAVRIVDKRAERVAAGHADGLQPRTMEVLQTYGLADRLLRESNQVHRTALYFPNANGGIERVSQFTVASAGAGRYPFGSTLHQGAIEAVFLDHMKTLDLAVDRQTVPVSIKLSEDEGNLRDIGAYPVEVILQHLDSAQSDTATEKVHAKFVVGADGAHSWVRKSLGIAMEGDQTKYVWGAIDMVTDTDIPDFRNVCIIQSNHGSSLLIPRERDGMRLYVQLSDADVLDPSTGRVDPSRIGPEEILEIGRRSLHPYKIASPKEFEWSTAYIIGQRVASKFSVNERIFIAGDACHTHSPKGGQGMNASISDSHNLAWKLAQVLRGTADMSLLKTYELERRKFAQDLIDFDRNWATLFSSKPSLQPNEDGVPRNGMLGAMDKFAGFTSGVGIHYADSAIVNSKHQALAKNITIGKRMPPQILLSVADARPYELQDLLPPDARFKILVFAGNTSEPVQRAKVEKLAKELNKADSFLSLYGGAGGWENTFDILTISSGKGSDAYYTHIPASLRSHWSKVFIDEVDLTGKQGGDAYANFGVESEGTVVVVRPDGYIGYIFPFDGVEDANQYFASFMKLSLSQTL